MIERIGMTARWSDAVVVDNLVFLAGHVAEATRGQAIGPQTEEVLNDLEATLVKAGSSKARLASVTIYLADMANFAGMNAAWDAWVDKDNAPARATVEARLAHSDYAIEITGVARR